MEDHEPSREALKLSLEDWSHTVFTAESGTQALELLQAQPEVRVLLTDWRLPGMDGLELCRRVREELGRVLYIVVMTARNERGDRIRALEAGADGFIDKPLDLQELRSQISVAARLCTLEHRLGQEISKLTQANAELKEEYETRETIRSLGINLASELERTELITAFLEAATQLVGADFAAFVPSDAEVYDIACLPEPASRQQMKLWTTRLCEQSGYEGLLLKDFHQESQESLEGVREVRSVLIEPLGAASGGRLGDLVLSHAHPDMFSERSRRVIQGLAAQAAVALDNARLYQSSVENQKRLQEQNLELQERFRQLEILKAESEATQQNLDRVLSGIQEAFVLLDSQMHFLYINHHAEVMARSKWGEMEGRSFWEIFPDFVGSELDETLQEVAQTRVPTRIEEYYPGRGQYFEHRIHPSSRGRLSIFSTDITMAKRIELAARKTELWLKAIFQQTSGFFAILHPDGRIADINLSFLDISGSEAAGLQEKPIWEAPWWPGPGGEELKAGLRRVADGERVREVVDYQHQQLGHRQMDRSLTPILDEVGELRYILVEGLDITELKAAQGEVEKARDQALLANRMKSQFLANMSHEIRTPLSGIQGMTEFLEESNLTPNQQEYVDAISRCSQGLMAIVGDVLDLSRIEAGELEIRESTFRLRDTVEELVALFSYRAKEKNVELECTFQEDLPVSVKGDPDRLRQILVNLVNNAVKFTDEGSIRVEVSEGELGPHNILFKVHDTGVGIKSEALDKLFKPFSQVDASPSRRHGGTGLGLSIVKKLVELLLGEVGCESTEGEGSTFWFEFPLPAEADASVSAPDTTPAVTPEDQQDLLGNLRVLLAEDSPINRRVVLLQLERTGIQADAVCNGLEVLEALKKSDYHLILMDCQMPELDGYQAATRIRESGDEQIVIVALTAHALKGEREKCLSAGMDDYVVKPLSIEGLQRLLTQWSHSPRIRPRLLNEISNHPVV